MTIHVAQRDRRALVAQHRMPEFDRERGSQRVLEVVDHLLAEGYDVTYLTLGEPSEERYVRRLARLGVPTLVGIDGGVRAALRDLSPDVAVVAFWHVAEQLLPVLREVTPSTKVIVDSVDLHFLRGLRRRFDEAAGGQRWIDEQSATELRQELNVYAEADAVLTVSDAERAMLDTLSHGGLVVHAVPLGEWIPRSTVPFDQRRGMVFVGNFRHLPNIEAVAYLCQEVLSRLDPALLAEHPLTIVGNELDDRVRAAARHPGVRLVGWVPDIGPYLERARAAVVPLLHGAGVKGKLLQSLMAGTPTVATSLAIEGTSFRPDADLLVADSAAAFARALTTVLTDAARWQELSVNGHEAARRANGVEEARRAFADALGEVLAAPARSNEPADSRRWARTYERVRAEVTSAIAEHVPAEATFAVLSGGDDSLLAGLGERGRHFPADGDGHHSFHPVDGAAAVTMLQAQQARGVTHVVVPSTAYWWLHQYRELHAELTSNWHLLVELDEVRVWAWGAPVVDTAPVLVVADAAVSRTHRLVVTDTVPDDLEPYARVVVATGRRLDADSLDQLLAMQSALGLDVAQAAADLDSIGAPGVPPAAVVQGGVCARRTRAATTALPVALTPKAFALLRGRRPDGEVAFGIVDATTAPVHDATGASTWLSEPGLSPSGAWSLLDVSVNGRTWQGMRRASGEPRVSVVIATYGRADLLERCLASLVDQTLAADQWEVVLVDDGSTDATPEVVRRWAGALPLRWVRIDHAGRSSAKNIGVLAAAGDIVLLLDDDDVADGDLLLQHVKGHDDDPDQTVAILGYTAWADGIQRTPLMHYVTDVATMLFAYHELNDGDRVGWRYFWEGRLSCKRSLLVEHGLHDGRLAYTIDIELGYRLSRRSGLTVVHRRSAVSWMTRTLTYDDFLERMSAKGVAQGRFAQLHPDPEIRAYCHVDVAERDWAAAEPTFEQDRQRIVELEQRVDEHPDQLPELHELYGRTLRGVNRRGVLLAASALAVVPLLSIVIPVWSVTPQLAEMAARTVERIWQVAQLPTEVIVVDNGSPHKVPMRATVLVENETNEGVAPAWNAGIARASAETIAVINSDVIVEPGWDVALHRAANDGRRIAFPYTDHADGLGPRRADQAGTAGWCFVFTRALFEEIGTFDEGFRPAFFEDADYWTRAHQLGVELSPVPAATVRHARRSTARHQPEMDALFQAHRVKYSWKYGIEPTAPPPYWHRPVVEYS